MSEVGEHRASESLDPASLGPDPVAACAAWLDHAYAHSDVPFPNAVCLSTVGEDGRPQGRMVLVKTVDERGLVFFTNYRSRKGRALEHARSAALTFYWPDLDRQVRVCGTVERTGSAESDEYFRTRPRGSQIGAWASAQSEELESRAELEAHCRELEARFAGADVPRPDHWGGYLLRPDEVEFWQGRNDRLHDRFLFRRNVEAEAHAWVVARLSP